MSLKDHSTLESVQQHLVTLSMYTYKVQEGITAHGLSPLRALQQARLVLHRWSPPSNQFVQAETVGRQSPIQLSVVSSFGLRMLRAQSTQQGELSHSRASLTQRESPSGKERRMQEMMLAYIAREHQRGRWGAYSAMPSACVLFM
jgi:hypothetical protein